MKTSFSPSVNIIRDDHAKLDYHVTPNGTKTVETIFSNFHRGIHSFNIIGSFGTGKSAFLWALEKSLKGDEDYFKTEFNGNSQVLKFVGEYNSLKTILNEEFEVTEDFSSNQKLFVSIFQRYKLVEKNNGILILLIDEFGKFLEYASRNNPEKEVYFFQKLAEFVNQPEHKILLITSIHQTFESYGFQLNKENRDEWKKVRGRFKDLTFNEPVEQLLFLASKFLEGKQASSKTNELEIKLISEFSLFKVNGEFLKKISSDLGNLVPISAYTIAIALQKYGQNERSLFTFLQSIKFSEIQGSAGSFKLPLVYDYLYEEFYNLLNDKSNPDYAKWSATKNAIERAEVASNIEINLAEEILKTLGLLAIFSRKGSMLNLEFFQSYFSDGQSAKVEEVVQHLVNHKILRFSRFDSSYKFTEGTDLDIEGAIRSAENKIDYSVDILGKLKAHFDFPIITAKSATYLTGTPRLFQFKLTDRAIHEIPEDEIDGFVNLIFSEDKIDDDELVEFSNGKPILYGYFLNISGIFENILEIEKTNRVLKDMQDENDRVAIKELKSIIKHRESLLSHYVMDSLYSDKVKWFSNGSPVKIQNKREFNQVLSRISNTIYYQSPVIQNELINRHKVSGSISSARKNLWRALVNNYDQEDLGFDDSKWPAEKTIYYTLFKNTRIHRQENGRYNLFAPAIPEFEGLWQESMNFLNEARETRKSLLSFIERLEKAPFKLKRGVTEFWIPTFLYIKRGDFALYGDQGFVPYIDENILYMMTRNPKEFYIKSFELNNLRLNLFNKYRDFLQQENKEKIDTNSFIESIRPLLIFYRDLTDYSQKTTTISSEATKLREAISMAKDPEKTFFEDFPEALGYSLKELASDDNLFEDYIIDFQNKVQEIKSSFSELLNRFEIFITDEVIGKRVQFPEYKDILQRRFESVKEHEALTKHKIFLLRLNSKLDDRDSFLISLGQALIGKSLNQIKDSDERLLKDKMVAITRELDNLVDLNKVETNEDEFLIKLELTTKEEGGKEEIVRLPKNQAVEMEKLISKFSNELNSYKNLKLPVLVSLLQRELRKNE
ncbi:hypothetical protein RM553_04930 [Zunongwangia sp. F363]|uniref:ATP-binding protein n=1 Tax=Autumnicola tepida TaxID=3075595 RepID=A0ABU3C745_9FLAO|nr:hypothetical protein [Zunongwangia sp. F363]MDT0642171.1 hypothetical protein [Zunongwangia sp. F363]